MIEPFDPGLLNLRSLYVYIVRPKFSVTNVSGQEYPSSMRKNLGLATIVFTMLFTLSSTTYANSASSLLNRPCKKVGAKTTSLNKKLTCSLVSGKRLWKPTPKSTQTTVAKVLPGIIPSFNLKYENTDLTATVIVNGQDLKSSNIEGAVAVLYAKVDGNYKSVAAANWAALAENFNATTNTVNFNFPLAGGYKGFELAVEIQFKNSLGYGDKALKAIVIPTVEPTPTPTPTPTATPTPTPRPTQSTTPAPVTSASPTAEVGCSVNYLSALPYANQRIAILSMNWEKDSSGYVFANATMRNDNSMALRLVNFSFYVLHKGSLIFTTSTLEGNHHFFVQDDAKFNSTDGASGPWMPGQVRTFKMPTNQMLECRSISVSSTGFSVKQGIGAS